MRLILLVGLRDLNARPPAPKVNEILTVDTVMDIHEKTNLASCLAEAPQREPHAIRALSAGSASIGPRDRLRRITAARSPRPPCVSDRRHPADA
jgi:hypothetical protein